MNTLATIIGSYGLMTNSVAVVIGAMVVASLTGPIIGMALALVGGDHPLMGSAFLAELCGAFIVVSVAFLIGLLNLKLPVTTEMLARTQPNLFNLVIALAAGAAGTYATVSHSLSARVVGVAVSTALALPLATCGLLLARENLSLAAGAFLLYLTNLVAIHIAAAVVLWLRGYRGLQRSGADWRGTLLHAGVSVALLLTLAIGFAIDLDRVVNEQVFESRLRGELTQGLGLSKRLSLRSAGGGATQCDGRHRDCLHASVTHTAAGKGPGARCPGTAERDARPAYPLGPDHRNHAEWRHHACVPIVSAFCADTVALACGHPVLLTDYQRALGPHTASGSIVSGSAYRYPASKTASKTR